MKEYPFGQQALGQIIEDRAATGGDKAFLQYQTGSEVTFGQVNEITNRLANGLLQLGLGKGDKVATFLPNCLEDVYLWFGMAKAGIIDVPVNLANKGDFLAHIINNSDAKVIVIDSELVDRLQFIERDLPKLQKVIVWSKIPADLPELKFEVLRYEDLAAGSADSPRVAI